MSCEIKKQRYIEEEFINISTTQLGESEIDEGYSCEPSTGKRKADTEMINEEDTKRMCIRDQNEDSMMVETNIYEAEIEDTKDNLKKNLEIFKTIYNYYTKLSMVYEESFRIGSIIPNTLDHMITQMFGDVIRYGKMYPYNRDIKFLKKIKCIPGTDFFTNFNHNGTFTIYASIIVNIIQSPEYNLSGRDGILASNILEITKQLIELMQN